MAQKNKPPLKKNAPPVEPGVNGAGIYYWAALAGLLAWCGFAAKAYFKDHLLSFGFNFIPEIPWGWMVDIPFPLLKGYAATVLLTAAFLFTLFHVGDLLLRSLFRFDPDGSLEWVPISCGLGAITFALTAMLLGFLHLLHAPALRIAFVALLALAAFRHHHKKYSWNLVAPLAGIKTWILTDKLLGGLLLLFILLYASMVFVPELFYDSLVYHLSIPEYYLRHHGIVKMEFLAFSTFPQAIHLFWTWALSLQEEGYRLVKALHFTFAGLTLLLIYAFCKSYLSRTVGLLAALFYYSTQYIAMNSWTTGNDAANSFMQTISMVAMAFWCLKGGRNWWLLSAVFAGFTLSSKYTALYGVMGTSIFWVTWQTIRVIKESRNSKLEAAKAGAPAVQTVPSAVGEPATDHCKTTWKILFTQLLIWGGITTILVSPWLIKNWAWIGNPVHPFFSQKLGAQNIGASRYFVPNTVIPGTVMNFQQWSIKNFFTGPWDVTMRGNDSVRGIGPVFLMFLPFLFFARRWPKPVHYLFWIFFGSYVLWFVSDPLIRYLTTFSALSIAAAWGVVAFSERLGKYVSKAVIAGAALTVLTNWGYLFAIVHYNYMPWHVISGRLSKDEYLSHSRGSYPNPSYRMFKYAEENLPEKGTRIVFMGENKAYYLKRDFLHSSVEWNQEPVVRWAKDSGTPDELLQKFRAAGVTHLLVNYLEAVRNEAFTVFDWKERDQDVFDAFWKAHVRQLSFGEGAYLYEIVDAPDASRPAPANYFDVFRRSGWSVQNMIQAQVDRKLWNEAIDQIESMIRMGSPQFPYLAYLYLQRNEAGDEDRALGLYQRSVQVQPNFAEGYFQMAVLLAKKGDIQNAYAMAQKALQLNPNEPRYQQLAASFQRR